MKDEKDKRDREDEKDQGLERRAFLKTTSTIGIGLAFGAASCGSTDSQTTQASAVPPNAPSGDPPPAVPTGAAGSTPVTWRETRDGPAVIPSEKLADDINVAFIGCGLQGRTLVESLRKEGIPGIQIKALCDISPYARTYFEKLLGKVYRYDVVGHVYEDYRELLDREKDLHAAIIATPDWMHAEQSIACMKAGLHVYCEKEMSNDLAKAREMVRTSRETGRLLQIGRQRRSHPRYRFALEKLLKEARLLGQITHARAQWDRSVATATPFVCSAKAAPSEDVLGKYGYGSLNQFCGWRWYRKYGGGPICDLGGSQIDVLGWFLGTKPTKVVVNGGRDYWSGKKGNEYEWYDNVQAIYEFPTPDGMVRAQYQVFTTTSLMGYYECFMGTEGALMISENPSRCRLQAEGYLQADSQGQHPWCKWEQKGYLKLTKEQKRPINLEEPDGGMTDLVQLYYASPPPPPQYGFNLPANTTVHGPHLRNFFDAIRGKEGLNCPGEVGYECAAQVLKVNQLLDAGLDSGNFAENDFKT